MKKILTAISVALIATLPVAAKTDLGALDKELEIMSSILHTALKQDKSEGNIRYRSLSAQYLARQGVVFNVNSSSRGGHRSFDFEFDFSPNLTAPPEPPEHDDFIDVHEIERRVEEAMEEINETEWGAAVGEALRGSMHALDITRDRLRELRSEERELSYEQRELERERRELEFESRNTEGDREKKTLDVRRKKLEKEAKRIKDKRAVISERAEKIEKEKKAKTEARIAEYRKSTKAFLANFEGEIADSLCRYGAGLRALPETENVTFVLPKFGDGTPGEKKDRIYVFNYKDVRACVGEKIDANELLEKAETYLF
jgi:hypothetical protein